MCYLLKLLVLAFLYDKKCKCKLKKYLKKINYFVFIMHQVNNHGISRKWFTETDVKHFKSGALRTITDITS